MADDYRYRDRDHENRGSWRTDREDERYGRRRSGVTGERDNLPADDLDRREANPEGVGEFRRAREQGYEWAPYHVYDEDGDRSRQSMNSDRRPYGERGNRRSYADQHYDRDYGGYGPYGGRSRDYGPYGGGQYPGDIDRFRGQYARDRDTRRSDEGRDFWDRAGDEIASWFGDEDATRRREADHRGKGPRNYTRSDDRIREDVNDRLTNDYAVDASDIEVTVSNREVTLDGHVSSRAEKRRAEDCADAVSGVTHVQNNLRVGAPGAGARDDSLMTPVGTTSKA
ncbi:SWFGD domain-containing protein [Consotaella salsifontis]|uniref:BON domain-containing protein n=1 Tax=Consotaella salsifontis TaxID=1365950 RepID=A0A1T4SI09_9HYPH|nr:SWFGD domain-containing protein [Consotaella salsifontis]SKA27793.1 BON domain-containing protein [Consotaella salsifontis]